MRVGGYRLKRRLCGVAHCGFMVIFATLSLGGAVVVCVRSSSFSWKCLAGGILTVGHATSSHDIIKVENCVRVSWAWHADTTLSSVGGPTKVNSLTNV